MADEEPTPGTPEEAIKAPPEPLEFLIALGATLRKIREDRGLTQEDAAHDAGVTGPYLGRVENAWSAPTVTVIIRLAQTYKVSFSAIFEKYQSVDVDENMLRFTLADIETIHGQLAATTAYFAAVLKDLPRPVPSTDRPRKPRRGRKTDPGPAAGGDSSTPQ